MVTHDGGPLLVEGVAGSGKTRLLLDRFAHMAAHGTLPDRIAFVLPSQTRADAARAALEEELADGYTELVVTTPAGLAATVLRRAGRHARLLDAVLGPADRLALLAERIDELPLRHHDFGGNAGALLAGIIRRIDRLKGEMVDADRFASWAASHPEDHRAGEFADIFRAHDRLVRQSGGLDTGDLITAALTCLAEGGVHGRPFAHVLADDAHDLDLASATLVRAAAQGAYTVAGDPLAAGRAPQGPADPGLRAFDDPRARRVVLTRSRRCPPAVMEAAWALGLGSRAASAYGDADDETDDDAAPTLDHPAVRFWRAETERAQAQAVAAEVERLLARGRMRIAILVPQITREGQAVAVALEERAVPYRLAGEATFFERAEVRDLLAWLRLLADPADAPAVVRALSRPPIELRSVDIARVTQIARRRKLDMVAALAAAIESPQVPPEARERIRMFLKLYRASAQQIDTSRPDLYVHRLIDRLGLRRQQLFAVQSDAVERLRALSRFGELAAAHAARAPQATARDFARSVAAVADHGWREPGEPDLTAGAPAVQIVAIEAAAGLAADDVFVVGLHAGLEAADGEPPIPSDLLREAREEGGELTGLQVLRRRLYVAATRARHGLVLCFPATLGEGGSPERAHDLLELARAVAGAAWEEHGEQLFGPAETLHSTYRLLLDEVVEGTLRAGTRLAELRLDTDLDVSHAVVRYLELLKVASLIARVDPHGSHDEVEGLRDALRDIDARIGGAITSDQREIFSSSPLDDSLLAAARDGHRRAQVIAARDEPSLIRFLPTRGDGVLLSATDIDTYRACPLKYKFARVFKIPQEPTLHQRFGIAVHQVLERYHGASGDDAGAGPAGPAPLQDLLALLDNAWWRQGFGDSDEERQLRAKAAAALERYHAQAVGADAEPIWFERQFSFKLGPHLVRGRVDRVDRLPGGGYELIDYKTGRPKSAEALADDVQLSLYRVAARRAWGLEGARGAYWYLLDDVKVSAGGDEEWIESVACEVADGIRAQEFEPTPSASACGWCDYRLACPAADR